MLNKRELEIKKGLENDPWFGLNKDITLDQLKSRQEVLEHIHEVCTVEKEIVDIQNLVFEETCKRTAAEEKRAMNNIIKLGLTVFTFMILFGIMLMSMEY